MNIEEAWILKEKYSGEMTEAFYTDCDRIKKGEPLAYVIGFIPFLHSKIYLDSKPLIPRTETEFWVEKAIIIMNEIVRESVSVLDLCAGSGCIGVSVLQSLPQSVVDFVEIDSVHHSTIQKNIILNGIDISRTNILGGDLFEKVTNQYDVILTNPPYIDPILDRIEMSVKAYEPQDALYGGEKGMEYIIRIIQESSKFLSAQGILIIEHEPEQQTAVHEYGAQSGYVSITHFDQFNNARYTVLVRK